MSYLFTNYLSVNDYPYQSPVSSSSPYVISSAGDVIKIATPRTIATSNQTGYAGEIGWDANYIYVCTSTDTWKRSALNTW